MIALRNHNCVILDGLWRAGQTRGPFPKEHELPRPARGQQELFPKTLYCGDNVEVLRLYQPDDSVDLVYADPVFKPQVSYAVLFKEVSGRKAAAQVQSFLSTWTWDEETIGQYRDLVEHSTESISRAMVAFRSFFGERTQGLAFLTTMASQLREIHRVLRKTGSFYLHCDPAYSHYLRLLVDAVFGPDNFRTEVIWKRSTAHSDTKQGRRQHGRVHDVIFFYTKSDRWTWNPVYTPYDESYIESHYRFVEEGTGRRFRLGDLTAAKPGGDTLYDWKGVRPYPGRYWAYSKAKMEQFNRAGRLRYTRTGMPEYKRYLDEMPGVPLQDVWTDIDPVNAKAAERKGFPTQKPVSLLKRIIEASTNPGDVVLDPFCGCGTTIEAAEELGRSWIGIDITHLAIEIIRDRLDKRPDPPKYEVKYEPVSEEDAATLAAEPDKSKFEEWALRRVGAKRGHGKGADRGIDGRKRFYDEPDGPPKEIIVSVKAGGINPAHVRDLRGVLEREKADIGVLVSMKEPSLQMRREASAAGNYVSTFWDMKVPRIQLLTVRQLLAGRTIEYPHGERLAAALAAERAPAPTEPTATERVVSGA